MSVSPPKPTRLSAGQSIGGRFQIVEYLDSGAFGEVYKANQMLGRSVMRQVALKLFRPEFAADGKIESALNDVLMLTRLEDEEPEADVIKRITTIYDAGVIDAPMRRPFIAMRLIRGHGSLRRQVPRQGAGGMPVLVCLEWLRKLLIPLAWMHTRPAPAVHGDLKPENVLVAQDWDLVLCDFGLAARMPIGTHGGTLPSRAPEALRRALCPLEDPPGPAADVYSVGVICYELLTGENPFRHVGAGIEDETALLHAHLESRSRLDNWPRPSDLNHDVAAYSQLEGALLENCLSPSLSKRARSAQQLLKLVEQFQRDGTIPGQADSHDPEHPLLAEAKALAAGGRIEEALDECAAAKRSGADEKAVLLATASVYRACGQDDIGEQLEQQARTLR